MIWFLYKTKQEKTVTKSHPKLSKLGVQFATIGCAIAVSQATDERDVFELVEPQSWTTAVRVVGAIVSAHSMGFTARIDRHADLANRPTRQEAAPENGSTLTAFAPRPASSSHYFSFQGY